MFDLTGRYIRLARILVGLVRGSQCEWIHSSRVSSQSMECWTTWRQLRGWNTGKAEIPSRRHTPSVICYGRNISQHITKPALIIGGAIYAYQNLLLLLTVTLHIRWPIHFTWASIQSSNSVVSSICLHSSRDIVWWRCLILISSFSEGKLSIIEDVLGLDGRWPGRQACVLQ